jgi:site-specific DNA recombinase
VKTYDALIRVSKMNGRKESAESTMTTDDQAAAIARAIREVGGRRGMTHEALDQSGFTIHRSDTYRKILDRVRAGKTQGIVVAYGDRLTRNWRAVGSFYDELEAAGAEVIIAGMPGVDYRTAAGRTMTGLMAVMSDAQYQTAKARGDAIAELTVNRGVPNRVPYGYRRNADPSGAKTNPTRDAKALVPDETNAPTVERIFSLRCDGHRWADIVKTLNEAGVPGPRGKHWTAQTIATIVQNEVYTGVVKLGQRRLDDAHDPLVSHRDWKRAQSTRTVSRHGHLAAGIAGGLLECASCGQPLSVAGYPRTTYSCRRRPNGERCPRPVHVSKHAADAFVEEAIIDLLEHGSVDLVANARELETLRAAAERATAERKAFVKLASALDPDDFRAGYDDRRTHEAECWQTHDEAAADATDARELPTDGSAFKQLDLTARRRVARSLIDAVVVSPPRSHSKRAPTTDRFSIRWVRLERGSGARFATR